MKLATDFTDEHGFENKHRFADGSGKGKVESNIAFAKQEKIRVEEIAK